MKIFKTLFLIIVISLITITVNATTVDTTSKSTVITDSTSLAFTKVYNDVKESILGLAEALKTPAEHAYEILVRQQIINSLSGTILIIVMLILLFISIRYLMACYNDNNIKDISGPILLLVVVSVTTFIILVSTGSDILTGFFNPEYGAIKDIVNFVK